jgi:hypothetical protein
MIPRFVSGLHRPPETDRRRVLAKAGKNTGDNCRRKGLQRLQQMKGLGPKKQNRGVGYWATPRLVQNDSLRILRRSEVFCLRRLQPVPRA